MNVTFIAEVASNHNRHRQRCRRFIEAAREAGFDGVKFQLFRVTELFAPEILARSPTHRARRDWELPVEFLPELAGLAHELGLSFACTPFYLEAVEQLRPFVDFYKIASYELLWRDLLEACARTGKPVVLSTGMATLPEIQAGVDWLVEHGCRDLTLLHCTSVYPTKPETCNLAAIATLRKQVRVPGRCALQVGWSDHSVCRAVIARAVHRWQATFVELHLDLDGQGVEHGTGHCWRPEAAAELIADIRQGLRCDGHGAKAPNEFELAERAWRADPSDGLRPLLSTRTAWPSANLTS